MDGVRTTQSLGLKGGAYCGGVRARRVESGGDFRLAETRLCDACLTSRPLNATHDEELASLGLHLSGSKVTGDLELTSVVVKAGVTIQSVQVGHGVLVEGGAIEGDGLDSYLRLRILDTKSGVVLRNVAVSGLDIVQVTGSLMIGLNTRVKGVTEMKGLRDEMLLTNRATFEGSFLVFGSSPSFMLFSKTQFNADVNVLANNVRGSLIWQECTFRGGFHILSSSPQSIVSFLDTKFLCDRDCQCDPEDEACKTLRFTGIEGTFELSRSELQRPSVVRAVKGIDVSFWRTKLMAPLVLNGIRTSNSISFDQTEFHAQLRFVNVFTPQLIFDKVVWDVAPSQVRWTNVEFDRLDMGPGDTDFSRVFDLVEHVSYSPQAHKSAAQFLEREGRADLSRTLLLWSSRAALREGPRAAGGYARFAWKWLLYLTIGGGVSPERAFAFLLALLVAGTRFYRRKDEMMWRGRGDEPHYSSFWYTLDLILPIMKLEDARDWWPRPERRFAIGASRVLRVLGFLMIPILIAAASGILK